MNKQLKIKVALMFFIAFLSINTQAQSCKSITSKVVKILDAMVKDYIEFRGEATKVFIQYIIPGKSNADAEMNKLVDKATKMQLDAYKAGGIITGQGTGKIGAVNLIIPTKAFAGSLVSTLGTERTFEISNSPYDKVYITVTKTDGGAGADIKACSFYTNGSVYNNDKQKSIEKGDKSKGNSVTFTFFNQENDKMISLHIVKTGLITDKFDYKVEVKGEFNPEKLK